MGNLMRGGSQERCERRGKKVRERCGISTDNEVGSELALIVSEQ